MNMTTMKLKWVQTNDSKLKEGGCKLTMLMHGDNSFDSWIIILMQNTYCWFSTCYNFMFRAVTFTQDYRNIKQDKYYSFLHNFIDEEKLRYLV